MMRTLCVVRVLYVPELRGHPDPVRHTLWAPTLSEEGWGRVREGEVGGEGQHRGKAIYEDSMVLLCGRD